MPDTWNASLYDSRHSFVNEMAADLIDLLKPKPGDRILDVGCGTGTLTRKLADAGATVVGTDASAAMITEATRRSPDLDFRVADATTMTFDEPFDAVFSNAALHWVRPPEQAAKRMFDALRPGGQLVLEMGGHGNVAGVFATAAAAGLQCGIDFGTALDINYFPTLTEYASILQSVGFNVTYAVLFDRPTPLEDGPRGLTQWLTMFRPEAMALLPAGKENAFADALQQHAVSGMFKDNRWIADYRRLRMKAHR